MKVVAFNGSPRKEGNTYQSIGMVLEELQKEGIETEIVQLGSAEYQRVQGLLQVFRKKGQTLYSER